MPIAGEGGFQPSGPLQQLVYLLGFLEERLTCRLRGSLGSPGPEAGKEALQGGDPLLYQEAPDGRLGGPAELGELRAVGHKTIIRGSPTALKLKGGR